MSRNWMALVLIGLAGLILGHVPEAGATTIESWQRLNGSLPGADNTGEYVTVAGDHMYRLEISGPNARTYYAPLQPSGEPGTWLETSTPSPHTTSGTTVSTEDAVYHVGGHFGSSPTTNVELATRAVTGALNTWQATSSLNTQRSDPAVTIANGYIYVAGGWSANTSYLSSVEFAPINPDGTLGAWQTTSTMGVTRPHATIAAIDGYLYAFGGGRHGYRTASVERALINPDGSLGSWVADRSLPEGRTNHGMAVSGNRVYVVGGYVGSRSLDVYSSMVLPDHTLDEWEVEPSLITPLLPSGFNEVTVSQWQDYIFATGEGTLEIQRTSVLQSAIPEPATAVCCFLGFAPLVLRRRTRLLD